MTDSRWNDGTMALLGGPGADVPREENVRPLGLRVVEGAAANEPSRRQALPRTTPRLVLCWAFDFERNEFHWADATSGLESDAAPISFSDYLRAHVHPEDLHGAMNALFHAVHDEQPYWCEYRLTLPGRPERLVLDQARILRDARGRARKLIGMARDVTDHHGAEEVMLAWDDDRLHALGAGASEGLLVHRGGVALYANPALAALFGYDSVEALLCAEDIAALVPEAEPDSLHACERTLLHDPQAVCRHEFRGRRPDGTEFWGEAVRRRVEWDGLPAVHTAFVDITERKRLAEQLGRARQTEAVALLAGGLAHDFSNVLQIVAGQAALHLRIEVDAEERRAGLQRILESARRGATLVRRLLATGRQQSLEVAALDVHSMIPDVFELLRPTARENLQFAFEPGTVSAPALGDGHALEQILINLYINARDAMPEGGTLTVRTADVTFDEAACREQTWAKPGDYVEIAVCDTGAGMPGEVRERIFEPYYSTKGERNGSGMGLCMVRALMEQQRGFLHVDSEPGRGTTVRLFLPVGEAAAARDDRQAAAQSRTVLLAEDDPSVARLITRILEDQGCDVIAAADGNEAVSLLGEHAGRISAVLLDTVMPGPNANHVYDRMRAIRPELPVVLVYASEPDAALTETILKDGQRVLRKPFALHELTLAVEQAMERSHGR